MLRTAFLLIAAAAASPALAQTPHYSAELAAAPSDNRLVVRDSVWRCSGAQCVSGRSPRRHILVCAGLARSAGEIRRFAVEGREFDSEQLATCNAGAR